jgi:hypothetical protein
MGHGKPTSTKRYITADLFHDVSFGAGRFSMAHRMCNFQLSPQHYEDEKKKIFEFGRVNGNPANQILKIIRKHEERHHIKTKFHNIIAC